MGKIIVSWSPVQGQSATTTNTVALASTLSLDHAFRSLLTHSQFSYSSMESMYVQGKKGAYNDTGMIALERLVKSKLLKSNAVPDYTETIYKSRLDFLPINANVGDKQEENGEILHTVLRAANEHYDFLWIDAHSGTESSTTRKMLKEADLVIVNLPQNKYVIEQFFNEEMFPDELKDKTYFIVVSQYDPKASYSLRNIKRQHKIKVPMFSIPYTTGLRDAVNQEVPTEFYFRVTKADKGESLYPLVKSLRDINSAALKQLGLLQVEADWT